MELVLAVIAALLAIAFAMLWIDAATRDAFRPRRHHDHLIPPTPDRYRPIR